jgi:hypothetical protein
MHQSAFFRELDAQIAANAGLLNAHAHMDRFATANPRFYGEGVDHKRLETIRLWDKHSATTLLHRGEAYREDSLRSRMSRFLEESSALGAARVDSFIDVAEEIPCGRGLGALQVALELKHAFEDRIELRVGAYPLFGFKDREPERWSLFLEAANAADFIGTSPERDDPGFYGADEGHIGLERHFRRTLELALELRKPIHYHLDQQVNPHESATEALVEVIEDASFHSELVQAGKEEPFVWAVHAISPATYDGERLTRLLDRMAALNIGVVCCPSAALSMRRIRTYQAPINKSLAEILPMIDRGMAVRIGTDNVDDMFLPATTLDPRDEVAYLSNALRFYRPRILAKLACNQPLGHDDRATVREHLEEERRFWERHFPAPGDRHRVT